MVQWLKIPLAMRGTRVQSLVWEDPTTTEPTCLEPMLCNRRSHLSEKPVNHNEE